MLQSNPLLQPFNTIDQTAPFDKIKNEHYEPAFDEGMQQQNKEIEAICANSSLPDFKNTIEALEFSGELLNRTSSIFFNLLSAESDDQMMEIAQHIQPKLTEHGNNIYLNNRLFVRVKAVYNQMKQLNLNVEQERLLEQIYDGFVNNGANLSDNDKDKYRELSTKLDFLTLQFGQNVLKATNAYEMHLTDPSQLSGIPEGTKEAYAQTAKNKGKEGWIVDLSGPSYLDFMKYADNRPLRKELYLAFTTKCTTGEFSNIDHIKDIINLRLEIAKLMGYENYAQLVLRKSMARNEKTVYNLLNDLLVGFEASAKKEYEEMSQFANKNQTIELQPYDWAYYSEKLKDSKFDFNEEMIRPYFELEHVKKGVFGLATDLFGITFKKNSHIPVYHAEVEAYEVYDNDNSFLAVLYTDFHPREGKRPGAWMTSFRDQGIIDGNNQRPHISIVMNFTRPTQAKPSLLSFDEVNTFLHEFGHALHGMFANTVYPSLSGTNVYSDFVELPSQLMENFLLEKEYLDRFAVHYQTAEKIPQQLIRKIIDSSNFNVGYLCLRQLSFGFLDMAYHTITTPYAGNVYQFEGAAIAATQILPTIEGALTSPAFSHIFSGGYAAGYYSYKWSEVLDADAFSLFKEKGIYNRQVANAYRSNILSKGGTDDPAILYFNFRGKQPDTKALLKRCRLGQ